MIRPVFLVVICGVLAGVCHAADEDAVGKQLAAAKSEYEKAAGKARTGLIADLKKKAGTAQKAGNLAEFKKVDAETKAFEDKSELPKSVPTKGYEGELRNAKNKLEGEYAAAVRAYTKAGQIAQAEAAQLELDEFRKGVVANAIARGTPLFDGKTLDGWRQTEFTSWQVANGQMVGTGRAPVGILIRDESKCSNFTLRCKLVPPEDAESRINFWVDENKKNDFHAGYWLIVGRQAFGELRWQVARGNHKVEVAAKKNALQAGKAVEIEVQVKGRSLIVTADGRAVLNHPKLLESAIGGFIGLRPCRDSSLAVSEITLLKQENAK